MAQTFELAPNGLVNVNTIVFLRRLLNPNGLQNFLDRTGFEVDILPYIESKIMASSPSNVELSGLVKWIKNNPVLFFTEPDVHKLTRRINNDLLLDPYYINLLGWSIPIYSDPYHLRIYATYAAVGLGVLWFFNRGKKRK